MLLPYFHLGTFAVGPLRFQYWGLFVALGIMLAYLLGRRMASRVGLTFAAFSDFVSWSVVGGLLGARLGHVLLYDPARYWHEPASFVRLWDGGLSIIGGLLGAFAAAWFWTRLTRNDFWRLANLAAFVLPLGLAIGRVGCYLINDHPGLPFTHFPAVAYPNGPRLDLGLLLVVVNALIFTAFVVLARRRGHLRLPFLAWFAISYGAARFIMDFLRAWDGALAETRWLFFTPAQLFALVFIGFGWWLLRRSNVVTSAMAAALVEQPLPDSTNDDNLLVDPFDNLVE